MYTGNTSDASTNRLVLNPEEMTRALQHYCKTVLFKPSACPDVKSVRQLTDGIAPLGSFEVTLSKIPTT